MSINQTPILKRFLVCADARWTFGMLHPAIIYTLVWSLLLKCRVTQRWDHHMAVKTMENKFICVMVLIMPSSSTQHKSLMEAIPESCSWFLRVLRHYRGHWIFQPFALLSLVHYPSFSHFHSEELCKPWRMITQTKKHLFQKVASHIFNSKLSLIMPLSLQCQ